MGRLTYTFKFKRFATLTLGTHGYYGGIKANSTTVLNSDYTYQKTVDPGQILPKQWYGVEAQLYMDLLGGLILKGEYITGVNSIPGVMTTNTTSTSNTSIKNDTLWITNTTIKNTINTPAITKNFSGWYVYAVKNIGKKHQLAVRYDYYDPNTKLSGTQVGTNKYDASKSTSDPNPTKTYLDNNVIINQNNSIYTSKLNSGTADIAYGTWTFGYSYFFTSNIKFMLGYEVPLNEKVNVKSSYAINNVPGSYDYNNLIHQNTLTVRLQVKF